MVKVAVALSGGVDSAVTAALLKQEGHQVLGVTMQVLPSIDVNSAQLADTAKICEWLNIPHYVFDLRDAFASMVIEDFCMQYSRGRTPNPCVRCNQLIKFGYLLEKAMELEIDWMATGHYVRVGTNGARYTIRKGLDYAKDQSYFLCLLTQKQLQYLQFPLGNRTKKDVRQTAIELNLPVTEKKESQEICFIPDRDYREFVASRLPSLRSEGPIVDRQGRILGTHDGIINYTIGQRRRIGIPSREPIYVLSIRPAQNEIVVGTRNEVFGTELVATSMNWIACETPSSPFRAQVKIRNKHNEARALVTPLTKDKIGVQFEEPQMAITPGQAAAVFQGDTLVGGGIIA
ncbi:MAG: tRNA 2-thiouridine(34) synthase MnmA [Dehalococcoidia bacterium]